MRGRLCAADLPAAFRLTPAPGGLIFAARRHLSVTVFPSPLVRLIELYEPLSVKITFPEATASGGGIRDYGADERAAFEGPASVC